MAVFSTHGANAVLNGTAIPATLHLKLHTGNPGAAGTANAATETTRKSFTRTTSTTGAVNPAGDLAWTSVAGTEDYTHVTVWDASTGGNCWLVGTCTANAVTAGDNFTLPAADVDLSLDIWS